MCDLLRSYYEPCQDQIDKTAVVSGFYDNLHQRQLGCIPSSLDALGRRIAAAGCNGPARMEMLWLIQRQETVGSSTTVLHTETETHSSADLRRLKRNVTDTTAASLCIWFYCSDKRHLGIIVYPLSQL